LDLKRATATTVQRVRRLSVKEGDEACSIDITMVAETKERVEKEAQALRAEIERERQQRRDAAASAVANLTFASVSVNDELKARLQKTSAEFCLGDSDSD
jgi:hypothetical protein